MVGRDERVASAEPSPSGATARMPRRRVSTRRHSAALTYKIASSAAPSSCGSETTASNAPPNGLSAAALSARETATTRFPDRTASPTASRAPRSGRAMATTRASSSSPLSSPQIAALMGEPVEATREPATACQRLHAPAHGGAAI